MNMEIILEGKVIALLYEWEDLFEENRLVHGDGESEDLRTFDSS